MLNFFPHPHHPFSLFYRGNYEWKLIVLRFQKNSFMCLLNPNIMWQLEHHYIVDCSAIFKLYYMLWGLSYYSQHIHRYFHLGILSVIVLLFIKFCVYFLSHPSRILRRHGPFPPNSFNKLILRTKIKGELCTNIFNMLKIQCFRAQKTIHFEYLNIDNFLQDFNCFKIEFSRIYNWKPANCLVTYFIYFYYL